MARYLSINIHTENLHDDSSWQTTEGLLHFFLEHNIKATWFVLNPSFVGYQAMGFDEEKWQKRLSILSKEGQVIEQHTHFYKGKEGVAKGEGYDLSKDNVLKRLSEDRSWLEKQGYYPTGFLSGAWQINKEIWQILERLGYCYDLSLNNLKLEKKEVIRKEDSLLIIPATASIKRLFLDLISFRLKRRFLHSQGNQIITLHFHDFDLHSFFNLWLLKLLILILPRFDIRFVSIEEFYQNYAHNLSGQHPAA